MHVIFNSISFVCLATQLYQEQKVTTLEMPCLVRNSGFYYNHNTTVIIIFYCYNLDILPRHTRVEFIRRNVVCSVFQLALMNMHERIFIIAACSLQ